MNEFTKFLDTDKNYQLIVTRHKKVHDEARGLGYEIMREARRINGLLLATDLLIEKLCDHEEIEDGDTRDKELKLLTGSDSESWYSVVSSTLDLLKDQIVDQCSQVVLAQSNYMKAKESASQHCSSLIAARDEAKKRFEKEQSDKAKK